MKTKHQKFSYMCFGTLLKLSLEHDVFSDLTSVCVIGDYKLLYSNITFIRQAEEETILSSKLILALIIFIFVYHEKEKSTNPLNSELNPTCHLLTLLGAHLILHVSRVRVKIS